MKTEKYKIPLIFALCILHFALVFPASGASMALQTCFSPGGKCSHQILREIGQAQREILIAVYAFTSDDLAWAVIKARQRGVRIQVVLDRQFDAENESSKGSLLEQRGIPIRRISGLNPAKAERRSGLMHQKFAVVDRKVVLTGSYNWTVAADSFNHENLLLFRGAGPLAEEYRREFFLLWEKGR